jgi:hypothetical protein
MNSVLAFIVVISFILLTSFNLSQISKLSIEEYIPISIFVAIIWTTLFGMFDKLLLGAVLLLPITLILALILFYFKRTIFSKNSIKQVLTLPTIFFIFMSAWIFRHSQHMQFFEWDEFTHWGPVVKAMFIFDQLGPSNSINLNNPNYPPALSVMSYLAVRIGGRWDEGDVLWAYQLLYLSFLIPVLRHFSYKKIGYFVLGILVLLMSSIIFYNFIETIYADPLLALTFGFSLFLATSKTTVNNWWAFSNYLITIFILVWIKDFGYVLVIVPSVLVAFNYYLGSKNRASSQRLLPLKSFFLTFISLFTAYFSRWLWLLYVSSESSLDSSVPTLTGSTQAISALTTFDDPYVKSLFISFIDKVFRGTITPWGGISLGTAEWIAIIFFLLVATAVQLNLKEQKLKAYFFAIVITIGAIANVFILFLIYITVYSGSNATSFTSYERYVSQYLAGVMFYIATIAIAQIRDFSIGLDKLNEKEPIKYKLTIPVMTSCLVVLLMFHVPVVHLTTYYFKPNEYSDAMRANFQVLVNKISYANFDLEDRVGIIAQHTMGFEYYVLQYEIMPASVISTGNYTWSIGSPSGAGDFWTDQAITPDKWNEYLTQLDYVIIYQVTESFMVEFGQFFENPNITEQGIYRVVHDELGNSLVKHV